MSKHSELASRFINWRSEKMAAPQATPGTGHNSTAEMKAFLERLENLETEKRRFADDIKDLCAEAKGKGYDPKALKAIVKEKMMDADKRDKLREQQETLEKYKAALGMLA